MFGSSFEVSDYKLTDLLSSAGATIGVIIAGTIFLQFLSSKFIDLSGRYRDLTGEYRGRQDGEPRHGPLRFQILLYRRRLQLLGWASCLGGMALLCLILAVLVGGLSMAFPPVQSFKAVGTGGLGLGLVLIFGGVVLHLWETVLARQEVEAEVLDLDDEAKARPHLLSR